MVFKTKRGLSPVVATVLLVAITLVLATIIFLWARSLISEQTQKNGQKIEDFCKDIQFAVDVHSDGTVSITNSGKVGLYGVNLLSVNAQEGSISSVGSQERIVIPSGGSRSFTVDTSLTSGQSILVVPVIVGESGNSKVAYTCDQTYAVETQVI